MYSQLSFRIESQFPQSLIRRPQYALVPPVRLHRPHHRQYPPSLGDMTLLLGTPIGQIRQRRASALLYRLVLDELRHDLDDDFHSVRLDDGIPVGPIHRQVLKRRDAVGNECHRVGIPAHTVEEQGYSPESADYCGVHAVPGEDPEGVQALGLGGDMVWIALHGGKDFVYGCCIIGWLLRLLRLLLPGGLTGARREILEGSCLTWVLLFVEG
mmetsp:Transcript_18000/g.32555  ORF Transcript_18000/g.32555 Transcript_18000/m.32555 type:complete len:212 (+) Transcript_18000:54-689(+)